MVRVGWVVAACCASGCWSDPPLIDGALTQAQLDVLRMRLALPAPPPPCDISNLVPQSCQIAFDLAAQLFMDPMLSVDGSTSCASCHAGPALIDVRPNANVSITPTGFTRRNTPTLLNVGYKLALDVDHATIFTWSGKYASPGDVLELAITKAMGSDDAHVAAIVRANGSYAMEYGQVYGDAASSSDAVIITNLEDAFDGYLSSLVAKQSRFDAYLAGDDAALTDSEKRGFGVFVGRGTCIECHNGPLLSDLGFHNTGVPQMGPNVPATDPGREENTNEDFDLGKFETPSLRNVALTAPYMHDGVFASLGDVIAFYRTGGVDDAVTGTKDPRIVPLDLDDDDAADLEAFLGALSSCPGGNCAD